MSLEENVNENVKPEISAEKKKKMVTAKIVKKGQTSQKTTVQKTETWAKSAKSCKSGRKRRNRKRRSCRAENRRKT